MEFIMKKYLNVFITFAFFISIIACKNTTETKEDVKKEFFGITLIETTGGEFSVKNKKDSKALKGVELKKIEKGTELEIILQAKDGYKPVKLIIGKTEYKTVVDNQITALFKLTENTIISAVVENSKALFSITKNDVPNGKITVKKVISEGNEQELTELSNILESTKIKVELEATDKTKYIPVKLTVGDSDFTTVQENKITHSFTISKDVNISGEVKAFFKISKNNVENGTITIWREHGGTLTQAIDSELSKILEGKEFIIRLSANAKHRVKSLKITKQNTGTTEVVKEVNADGRIEKKITVNDNITVEGEVELDPEAQDLAKVEINIDGIKFKMVNIPELSTPTKICGQEGVTLSAYHLSETEVTQSLYQKVMGENPTTTAIATDNEKPKCPVAQITWYEAVAFCNELTILNDGGNTKNCMYYRDEKKTEVYRKNDAQNKKYPYVAWQKKGFRLPTEAEWERGALAGEVKKYPGSESYNDVAWADPYAFDPLLHNVATKQANAYGLHDMAGNVAEWVWDPYIETAERKNNTISRNPTYKHTEVKGSCFGYATIRGGNYLCCGTYATTPLMCTTRDELACKQKYDSIDGFETGIRIAKGAFNVPVKVFKLRVGTYELAEQELEEARKDTGFTKEFEKGASSVKIEVEADAGATANFEMESDPLILTETSKKVVVRVSKEEFVDQVFTLFLSKRAEGVVSEIVNGTKKEYQVGSTGVSFNMVSIAPVENVTLGSVARLDNKPHIVSLSAYQISETEVTQKLYKTVTGENPSFFTEDKKVAEDEQDLRPVEQVNWYKAVAFCNMLTSQVKGSDEECVYYNNEELTEVYTMEHAKHDIKEANKQGGTTPKTPYIAWQKKGFRLPTEAEWEWASFGGENGKYSGSNDLLSVAWCGDNATQIGDVYVTRQVAKKQPNGYGLYDMTGNVFEWCGEWRINDNTPIGGKDPKGPQNGAGIAKYKSQRSSSYGLRSHEKHESTHRDFSSVFDANKTSGIRLISKLF